jgi:hypothetical protein
MGLVVGREGSVLTSASIMADCRAGLVKTADGALHIITKISRWDSLQDVALVQLSRRLKIAPRPALQPPKKLVGIRKGGAAISGGKLTGSPFRLTLPTKAG